MKPGFVAEDRGELFSEKCLGSSYVIFNEFSFSSKTFKGNSIYMSSFLDGFLS